MLKLEELQEFIVVEKDDHKAASTGYPGTVVKNKVRIIASSTS